MKTFIQVIPDGPLETFNDAPMRVNGVKITPTWAWSDKYRAMVRQEMRRVTSCPYVMATQYKRWFKETHGREYVD